MISNCGHDERNKYTGGKAGDQTGTEWTIREWYDRPWNCVLRYPYADLRKELGDMAEKAARNDNVGYDMYQRYTFWEELKKVGYDPSKIKTPCEADCSSGIVALVRALGFIHNIQALKDIPETLYTENMESYFKKAGFEVITDKKVLKSQDYLMRGDILLNRTKHTTINLTDGSKIQNEPVSKPTKSIEEVAKDVIAGKYGNGDARKKKLTAEGYDYDTVQKKVNELLNIKPSKPQVEIYKVCNIRTYLNVRKSPNGQIVGKLYNGNLVNVVSVSNGWAKLDTGNYISTNYIKKA